ncbi:MAG: LacI family DNA-binding transcriptional regulator [Ruminococcus sp.]|jgi:DNA-binding LacI/PurR family transcriptional regulator
MKLTVRKIAELAGVSPAAVSLVLNDKPGVRPELRSKLTELLVQNGYTIRKKDVSAAKRILYLCYKDAVRIPYIRNEFSPHIMDGVEHICRQRQHSLSIVNATEDSLAGILKDACDSHYDGIIFLGTEFRCSDYTQFEHFPIPIIFIDHHIYGYAVNTLNNDSETGSYQALSYLKSLGHTDIGYITSRQPYGTFHDRRDYFFQMMKRLDIPRRDEYMYNLDYFREDLQQDFREQLEQRDTLPTAFITGNDIIGAAVFSALSQKGYRIPEDISIIGFDDSAAARMTSPQLTTVHVNLERFGELAIERLLQMMDDHTGEVLKISTGTTLTVRGSTAPPRR